MENPDSKPEVNHKDGNKNNNHASNLEWTTTKDNIHHAWETGLSTAKKGVIHPESKYTENQIRSVCRYLENNKFTMKEISELTGVTYTVVKQIRNHVIWRSISIDYNIDAYNIDSRKKKGKKKYENKL